MIDLHSHILHNIDDGSRSLDEAVAMAEAALDDGVTVMVATPHGPSSISTWTNYSVALMRERLSELRAALVEAGVPLKIVAGTEILAEPGSLERLQAGQLLTYGTSRAILIEFPLGVHRSAAEQLIFAFQLAGYRVVLAHPERYRFVREDLNVLIPLIERGVLMQLTCDALLGVQGERTQRIAETMLHHGLAQILATDAHGLHMNRVTNLGVARRRAVQLVGEAQADALTRLHPEAVLSDAPITPAPATPVRKWHGGR